MRTSLGREPMSRSLKKALQAGALALAAVLTSPSPLQTQARVPTTLPPGLTQPRQCKQHTASELISESH